MAFESNIAIRFHNGAGVVDGTIIDQKSDKRFVVRDANGTHEVMLARTKALAENLEPGFATILFTPLVNGEPFADEHVYRLNLVDSGYIYTIEGGRFRRNDPFQGHLHTKDIENT